MSLVATLGALADLEPYERYWLRVGPQDFCGAAVRTSALGRAERLCYFVKHCRTGGIEALGPYLVPALDLLPVRLGESADVAALEARWQLQRDGVPEEWAAAWCP